VSIKAGTLQYVAALARNGVQAGIVQVVTGMLQMRHYGSR
jgi:hypothetical protein